MTSRTAARAIALALVLCLMALEAAPHVHLPDPGKAPTECSLCASGNQAQAVGSVAQPTPWSLRQALCAIACPAPVLPEPRVGNAIRGPPPISVA